MASPEANEAETTLTEVARALFAPGTVRGTLQQIVDLAAVTVDGCEAAGIFVVTDEQVTTPACSDPIVVELDALQFETDQGPCLDAVSEGGTFYAEDLEQDPRWPTFGAAATARGIRSILAIPLSGHPLSALNLYARLPAAFGPTDRGKGLLFATLAGLALGSAELREDDERKVENLHAALQSRELIGQAQGILMERKHITPEDAFNVLRRASQHMNLKLRDVAQMLVDTGETPQTGTAT